MPGSIAEGIIAMKSHSLAATIAVLLFVACNAFSAEVGPTKPITDCLKAETLTAALPCPDPDADEDPAATSSIPKSGRSARSVVVGNSRVALGIYDPHLAFSNDRNIDIEHIFVFWQALDLAGFRQRLAYAEKRNRTLMVTIEPYTRAVNWRDGGDHLFSDIVKGAFRPEIDRICTELSRYKGQVLVRWGHEMEDPTGRYPWARKDSDGYKAAYRYFVSACRQLAPRAAFVWSPKGEKQLGRYYPGAAYVDYVGLSVWGLQKMDIDYFGHNRQFETTFPEKYSRVAGFAKPVIIAELGVSGDNDYRHDWFENLFQVIRLSPAFRLLRAVVYFNDKEPASWPLGYGSPDWRIGADWFSRAKQVAQEGRPSLL